MGQQILGGVHVITQGVVLDCDPKLVGDSLSVHLDQQATSTAIWRLHAWVQLAQGWFHVGFIDTDPLLGGVPSRLVMVAGCPGAIGWRVEASSATEDEIAELTLQSSTCCSNIIGVQKIGPIGPTEDDPWPNIFSVALANAFVIKPAPGILRSITLRIDATLATGTYYIQSWNFPAVPADTTVVTLANGLAGPVKVVHVLGTDDLVRYDFDEFGIEMTVGGCLGLSSTEFTKTAVAGAFMSVYSAEYR